MNLIHWHSMLVHFPIAFYFLELVLLVFWTSTANQSYHYFAVFSFGLGYLFMLLAIPVGFIDAGGWGHLNGAIGRHSLMAGVVFCIATLKLIYLRKPSTQCQRHALVQVMSSILLNIFTLITAFFGGILVY